MSELHRMMPLLLADFSGLALASSLGIHAVNALARCVERGDITYQHARDLIKQMAELSLTRADLVSR